MCIHICIIDIRIAGFFRYFALLSVHPSTKAHRLFRPPYSPEPHGSPCSRSVGAMRESPRTYVFLNSRSGSFLLFIWPAPSFSLPLHPTSDRCDLFSSVIVLESLAFIFRFFYSSSPLSLAPRSFVHERSLPVPPLPPVIPRSRRFSARLRPLTGSE